MEELLLVPAEGEDIEMQRNDATCVVHAGPQSEEYSQAPDSQAIVLGLYSSLCFLWRGLK